MYLREMKEATVVGGGLGVMVINFGGIPSTILFGWFSDLIGGRRGMVCVLCLIPILAAFTAMIFTPPGFLWLDMLLLSLIGLFIYPVINLIVIIALDLTGKAIGTAAGLIGLFGYIGRTVQAIRLMLEYFGALWGKEEAWALVIVTIIVSTLAAIVLLAFTRKMKRGPDRAERCVAGSCEVRPVNEVYFKFICFVSFYLNVGRFFMAKHTILVTGGAGYGSHVVDAYVSKDMMLSSWMTCQEARILESRRHFLQSDVRSRQLEEIFEEHPAMS